MRVARKRRREGGIHSSIHFSARNTKQQQIEEVVMAVAESTRDKSSDAQGESQTTSKSSSTVTSLCPGSFVKNMADTFDAELLAKPEVATSSRKDGQKWWPVPTGKA